MKDKNKSIRNLTIGAVTGGLIVGGLNLALNDRKPFIREYIESYRVTTDTTISTTEGLTRLKQTIQYLTADKIKNINQLEVKSYIPSKDNYDVEVYGFSNDSLTDKEITTKQNQFENGNALLSMSNYDNHDEYQVEARELPDSYENILEEINVKTINYDSVIMVKESRKTNIKDTTFWILMTAVGAYIGLMCANAVDVVFPKKLKKKTK